MSEKDNDKGIRNPLKEKKNIHIDKSFILSREACDEASMLVMDFCSMIGVERKDALRYSLSIEECMLYWLDHGCGGKQIRLHTGKHMRTPFIELVMKGGPLNPYSKDDEEYGIYTDSILISLNLGPEYVYERGKNRIIYRLKKKSLGQIATLGIIVLLAFLIGMAGVFLFPDGVREMLLKNVIDPIYDTFFKILGCIAGPMIFLSVAWGVYGIGDAATFGRIGKKMMIRFSGTTLLVCACCSILYPLLGPRLSLDGGAEGQLSSLVNLFLGIFPATIIEPFSTGNTLQIIFVAIVIGITLLYLGRQTSSIARAIEQVNLIVQFLMVIISKLVPSVIFLIVINLIWSGKISVMISSWKIIAVLLLSILAVSVIYLIVTSIRFKTGILTLVRKSMPTFFIALTTASSAAAFNTNVSTCEKKYGINSSLIQFGIPLGLVMHKPLTAVYNMVLVFFFANKYNIHCSISWIIIAVIVCSIVAIATPPIPGGGAIAYSVIFTQMGIPADAMSVALAIDIIIDFVLTAFEMLLLQLTLIHTSNSLGMLDRSVLAEKNQ